MTTYFITICAHMQRNLFQRDEIAQLMVGVFLNYRDTREFELHEYVVMPNHVHLLLSLNDGQKLGRVIQLIKGGFSHALREHEINFPVVWQQRYHDRRVRDGNEFAEFPRYILSESCAERFSGKSGGLPLFLRGRAGAKAPESY